MNTKAKKIRIAIQNQGRLMYPSLEYLQKCGLNFTLNGRKLIVPCENANMELIFVRNGDIPEYVNSKIADFGIVGQNVLMEKKGDFKILKTLGFGKCSLVIATPKKSEITKLKELNNKNIATSYPLTLKTVLKKENINAFIIDIKGSVEICPSLGLSDAIFDITQTGRTLKENGLKIIKKIADSQAVLIKSSNNQLQYENIFL